MGFVVIYIFILIVLLLAGRNRWSVFRNAIYFVYLLSAISGFILFFFNEIQYVKETKSYLSLFFLLLIVVLWAEPYSYIRQPASFVQLEQKDTRYFNKITSIVCAYFLPLSLLLFYNAYHVLTTVDVSVFRLEADYNQYFVGGKVFALAVYSSMLYFVPLFLFFLSFKYQVSVVKRLLLLICSLSFALMTLCFAGRDGIVYWLMNSFVFYLFLRDSYTVETRGKVKRIILYLGVVIVVILSIITFIRFIIGGQSDGDNIILPMLDYIGQEIHIFCQSTSLSVEEMRKIESTDFLGMTFGTFVKTFISRYGYWGTILVSLIQFVLVKQTVTLFNKTRNVWIFFIIFLFFQIPYYGVFYYRQNIQSMELVYLVAAIMFLILKVFKVKTIKI